MTSRKARSGKGSTGSFGTMRTTRSSTSGRRRGGGVDAEKDALIDEDNYLQSEYITNLQQQIYFLELELQVMKEKQASGRFAGKALSSNVPLDTHMNSLRDKYMSMEKKFKKKIRKMEEEEEKISKKNEELTMKLDRATTENKDLSEKVEKYEQDREASNNSHLADKLKLENRVEKLNEKLTEKNNLYESISDKYREFRIESRTEIDKYKDEIRNLKKEIEDIKKQQSINDEQKKKVQVQLIECQENVTLKSEEITQLKNENFNYRDEIRGWEHKFKKLEMDIEQEKEVCTKYERENQNLRKKILELEQEIKDEQKKVSDIEKSEDRWSQNIIDLRTEIEKKTVEIKGLNERCSDQQIKINQYIEDSHRLNEQINDTNDKLSQSNELLMTTNNNLKKLEDVNLELKKDNIIKTDIIDSFNPQKEALTKEVNKTREQNELLIIEVNNLKQKLNVANKLENINLDEFKTLCSTNLRVADSIKTLMSTINQNDVPHNNNIINDENDQNKENQ